MASPLVLVTGSTGYLGSPLVERLGAAYRVVGLDQKPPRRQVRGLDFIECDLTRDESVARALDLVLERYGRQIASCVHLAAYYDFSGEPSPLYRTLTVDGTKRLLDGLKRFQVEQIVFSSTHIVMKPAEEGQLISETSPVAPAWDYPRSKLQAEEVLRANRGDISAIVLRLAGVYDEDTHAVPLAQQMRRIYEKQFESIFFPGDASHGQAFVHLDDAVASLERAVERRHKLPPYEMCLVAEPDVLSYAELQDRLGELIHGQEWPTIRIPKTVAKAGVWVCEQVSGDKDEVFIKPWMIELADDHYPIAIDHAHQVLDWQPVRRLRDTLPEMVNRLLRDPLAWYRTNKLELPSTLPNVARSS